MSIADFFIIFMTYSVVGYFLEIIYISTLAKIHNTSYFHSNYSWLPVAPPYGFGALILIIYQRITLFNNNCLFDAIFCGLALTLVEYLCAAFCEKVLHQKYWDYSKQRFNIKGRVCLLNTLCYIFAGMIFLDIFYTPTISMLRSIPAVAHAVIVALNALLLVLYIGNQRSYNFLKDITHRDHYTWGNGGL